MAGARCVVAHVPEDVAGGADPCVDRRKQSAHGRNLICNDGRRNTEKSGFRLRNGVFRGLGYGLCEHAKRIGTPGAGLERPLHCRHRESRSHRSRIRRASPRPRLRRGGPRGGRPRRRTGARWTPCAPARATSRTSAPRAWRRSSEKLAATTHYDDMKSCDAVIICVPTPLTHSREPDLSYLTTRPPPSRPCSSAARSSSLESTTYPGTTRERLLPDPRGVGAGRGARLPPRLLAGAHRPGPHRLHDPHHPEGGRRPDRGVHRARPPSSTG